MLACALALFACASDVGRAPPLDFEVALTRTRLDNGLEVVVIPDAQSPVATAITTFRAGAMVETPETNGYSHLLEHMMFKGSGELPDPLAFRAELRRLGVLNNATTGIDRVNFFYTLPRANLREGMELMAGALRSPALDEASLTKEIAVVLSEFDLADSDWSDRQRRRVLALLHPDQPSRTNPLGTREVVSAATREALLAMHGRFYVPNNAMLALAGGVDAEEGMSLARELFGSWQKGRDPFADAPVPAPQPLSHNVAEVMVAPVQHATLQIAWQGPATLRTPEASVAADLLAELSITPGYPLRRVVGAPAVLGAVLKHYDSPHGGVLLLELLITPGHEHEAAARLRSELRTLGEAKSLDGGVLDTAIDKVWSQRFHAADASTSSAHWLSNTWGAADLDYAEAYFDRLYSLSSADVRGVVADYVLERPFAAVLVTSATSVDAASLLGAL